MSELIRIDGVTAVRPGGEVAFADLSWTLRDGETWAVVGLVGCGKTTLAALLAGKLRVRSGSVGWPLVDRARAAGRDAHFPGDVVRVVSFKEESRLFSYRQHYYQERFNFTDPLDDITLGEFLRSGLAASDDEVRSVADRLGVGDLTAASFLALSNGQVRRARIARALLAHPELLVLDEPFMGLDVEGREEVSRLLGELVDRDTRVVLMTRPEFVPPWATHVLELDRMRVMRAGQREDNPSPGPSPKKEGGQEGQRSAELAPGSLPPPSLPGKGAVGLGSAVVEMHDVTVAYGGKPALRNVSWTVRAGERWAVLGPNGCGKTTLLSLVCGDHPQAYGNDVRVFGRRRGTGESIWDIKKRIGLVSPELHLYFSEPLTAHRAAATGFFDVMAYRPATPDQDATIRRLFAEFGLTDAADRPFARLSTGQQRLVLLVRAMVKGPELLILDEPFQGLDHDGVEHAKGWLDQNLRPDQTLLFVTHYADEIPASVNRVLRLDAGRVVQSV